MNFDKTYDMLDNVRERLEATIPNSSVDLMPSDTDDFFITVTQRNETTGNESKWSFCVDFRTNTVEMLEPVEDEESFRSGNEVFGIIKNFLNGGMSREKRMNRLDYDSGKPIKITGFGNKIGSSKVIKSSKYIVEVGNDEIKFDNIEEANETFRQAVENNDINTSIKIYVDEGYSNKHLKLMRSERGRLTSSRKPIKSGWERTDMASGPIWDKDNWRIIECREHSRNGDDVYYMLRDKDNLYKSDIRFDTLAEAMDHVDLRIPLSRKPIKSSFTQDELNCLREMIVDGMDERFYDWYSEKYGDEPWKASNEQMDEWIKSDSEITKEYNDYLKREMPYYEPGHDEKYVNEFLKSSRKPIKSSTDYIEEYIASDSFAESGAYQDYIMDKLSQKGFSPEEIEFGWYDDPVKSAREEIEKNYSVDDYINWAKDYITKDKYKMMWYKDWLMANGYPVEEEPLMKQYSFDPANNTWPGPSHQ